MSKPPAPPSPQVKKWRREARQIWQAGVNAVQPESCLAEALDHLDPALPPLTAYDRILVVGAGKAGAGMARVLENALERHGVDFGKVQGLVNVPEETVVPLRAVHLHPARPAGTNQPTQAVLDGTQTILDHVAQAGPNDLLIGLWSGGGSALLCAPPEGISLADKQAVTQALHRCGAAIQEMNAVRKHLSRVKGGGLVRGYPGRHVLSFLISDVIGDPVDVIASGPTCVDPTTFADALAVLEKYHLLQDRGTVGKIPNVALNYLVRGAAGQVPETLKQWPANPRGEPLIHNRIVGNNARALAAAAREAEGLGYQVLNLGPYLEGETRNVAKVLAAVVRGQRDQLQGPLCVLSGGETTVTLGTKAGKGGRNQEFALALLRKLGKKHLPGVGILCAGTDGEDGPTDAAGAFADADVLAVAEALQLSPSEFLARHDAYPFFEQTGGLLRTGLTHTNVMDLRVMLLTPPG